MRFNRVLLVSPPAESRYGGLRVPAGVGYIAQALEDRQIEYDYLDMRIGRTYQDLVKKVTVLRPDLIGFSMSSLGYKNTYRMIASLKERFPATAFAAGGHHITILRSKALEECAALDYGVVSDGERTIVELCEGSLPERDIRGLIYRNGNGRNGDGENGHGPGRTGSNLEFTGERAPVMDLDKIAFPKYIHFNMNDYSRQIPIHSSRGCLNQCTFCPNKLIAGTYRTRSAVHFTDEIEYWYEKGIRQFAVDDDNFTFNKERVLAICDEIERRGLKGLFIRCSNGLRADRVDRLLLARMKEIGVKEVGFGVDGGNNRMLRHMKKGETIETIENAIRTACDLELDVRLFFMIGMPHETLSDIEDSIRLAQKYPVVKVNLNNPIPYPGTELYDYIERNKLFLVPPEDYLNGVAEHQSIPVFTTPELSLEERSRILKRCQQLEKEITGRAAGRLLGRFQFLGMILNHLFLIGFFERLFFRNLLFRRFFERLRYNRLIKN